MRKYFYGFGVILCIVLVIFAGLYVYNRTTQPEVRELNVPGKLTNYYLEIGRTYDVPWFYLATIDEVQSQYKNVTYNSIKQNAIKLKDKEIKPAIEQLFTEQAPEMLKIASSYQWEAAPIGKNYAFPFAKKDRGKISYGDSWGSPRSYGGKRRHEGTDLMSPRGTPLVAVTAGKIVRKGWDELGGWRLFLQDEQYPYLFYYYAHLSRYADGLAEGTAVKKGQVVGYVGATGYGPEGTSGKFKPHLHFGVYVYRGLSFSGQALNPYPFLKAWEAVAR